MTDNELQLLIDTFIERHGLSASTFGLWAMNDSRFVFDLRNGRTCMNKTMRRVLVFMRDYDAKRGASDNLVSPPSIASVRQRADAELPAIPVCAGCGRR